MPKRIWPANTAAVGVLVCLGLGTPAMMALSAPAQPAPAPVAALASGTGPAGSLPAGYDDLDDVRQWRQERQTARQLADLVAANAQPLTAAMTVVASFVVTEHSQPLLPVDPEWLSRTAQQTGIPSRALQAYQGAALSMARSNPGCQLGWVTLAGVGSVESNHGRYSGASIGPDGNVSGAILGPVLDGNGFAGIPDTDGGLYDGDKQWDRAVGPMQFIPSTWARWGTDANGDGKADPSNIDDAAMSAARYLCASGGSLASPEGWMRAILSYNHSVDYTRSVRAAADGYAAATSADPIPTEPPLSDQDKQDQGRDKDAKQPDPKPEQPTSPVTPPPTPPVTPPTTPPVSPPVTPPTTEPPTTPPSTPATPPATAQPSPEPSAPKSNPGADQGAPAPSSATS
ncbi:lytic transglycosylase domain-containing protein [Arthrobacter russicus]|uniref:Membrane-bound lytic murein transglycosylase B n=1 Tax=Arthrobacter russicus TaxID=172040 RepID=A0ABU1JEA9_9MICC|nr:lytic murein transglycosylase [Arthrobacter russicus]MDR6270769.1 membrane-bound lytic murein transglycosylase B [Arthrobacter russicus]